MSKMFRVLLLFDTSGAASRRTLRGIAKYSKLHGPWVFSREPPFYIASTFGLTRITRKLPNPKTWDGDGVIAHIPYTKHWIQIVPESIPAVISLYTVVESPDFSNFVTDDVQIGRMAAEYFIGRNFRNFAFFGYRNICWSQTRGQSFSERLAKAGFTAKSLTQSGLEPMSTRSKRSDRSSLGEWLHSLPKPIAIMACNDDRALDVCDACRTIGLHIPHEVAILGVDNDDLVCELANPPLSSIAVNNERAGYEAAALLDQLMSGKKDVEKHITAIPTHIVTRQSTDIFAVADPEVAKALRFVQQHSTEDIHVDDVVGAVPLSRRVLESRFRKAVDRSILSEIRRARVEQVVQMLVETNLPISEIAKSLSYSGIEHIARYFRREKGMSLIEYRRRFGQK
jgi:LacI family transcriptional regulator